MECVDNCSVTGYEYYNMPEKICINTCKTGYPFFEYPTLSKICKKRCASNRYLSGTKNCVESVCDET